MIPHLPMFPQFVIAATVDYEAEVSPQDPEEAMR